MKQKSIDKRIKQIGQTKIVFSFTAIGVLVALFICSLLNVNQYVLLTLLIIVLGLLLVVFGLTILNYRTVNYYCYHELYAKTLENYNVIHDNNFHLVKYDDKYNELHNLNLMLDSIQASYENKVFYKKKLEMKDLNVEYVEDKELRNFLITKDSFIKNMKDFIDLSTYFSCGLILFKYDSDKDVKIPNKEILRIEEEFPKLFKNNDVLFGKRDDYSLFIFVRNIDSPASLDYLLREFVNHYHYIDYKANKNIYTVKLGAVIYPFSQIDNIFSDLYYASKRKGMVNVYIPNRNNLKKGIYSQGKRISYLSLIVEEMTQNGSKVKTPTDFEHFVVPTIASMMTYFDFNNAGFIYKSNAQGFVVDKEYALNNEVTLGKHTFVEDEFIKALERNKLENNTVLFSTRENVPSDLGVYFDKYRINSGFFGLIYLADKLMGVIYFINKDHEFFSDLIDKQYLILYASEFRNSYSNLLLIESNKDTIKVTDSLLKTTKCNLYEIDAKSYYLIVKSEGLKPLESKSNKKKTKCYEVIYNLKAPCKDCPLLTGKAKSSTYDDVSYSTSLKLTTDKTKSAILLMQPTNVGIFQTDIFDSNIFISSRYSFIHILGSYFLNNLKGFVLLYRIENLREVVKEIGELNYNNMMRDIADKIATITDDTNCYLYAPNALALIFNEQGRSEIFDIAEKINHFIKHKYFFENKTVRFTPSLFVFNYPQDFDSLDAFIRHIETSLNSKKPNLLNKMYLVDQHIERFASETDYCLSLLEKANKEHAFELRFTPIFHASDKSLAGADLTFVLKDDLRGDYLRTAEVMRIVKKESKTFLYTNTILDQVGNNFNVFDNSIYRITGMEHIVVPVNIEYFLNNDYVFALNAIRSKYSLLKNYLIFAIDENECFNNLKLMKQIFNNLEDLGIKVMISRYTGKLIPLVKVKELGASSIKIEPSFIDFLVDNTNNTNDIKRITEEAISYDLTVSFENVNTDEQYDLLKDMKYDFMEGLRFSPALGEDEFNKFIMKFRK